MQTFPANMPCTAMHAAPGFQNLSVGIGDNPGILAHLPSIAPLIADGDSGGVLGGGATDFVLGCGDGD
jgi:hypothetical protein